MNIRHGILGGDKRPGGRNALLEMWVSRRGGRVVLAGGGLSSGRCRCVGVVADGHFRVGSGDLGRLESGNAARRSWLDAERGGRWKRGASIPAQVHGRLG